MFIRVMFIRVWCLSWALSAAVLAGSEPDLIGKPSDRLRQNLKLDPFYQKCLQLDHLPILASAKVSDYALREAVYIVDHMLAGREDLRQALVRQRIRVVVMAPDEFTTSIPEHRDLRPAAYWDKRARGLGATRVRPAVSCGEENLLQYRGDPYQGENILVHEFAHAIHELALRETDPSFDDRVADAYEAAMREELWNGTYAGSNRSEYWAEGVQSWFDCNRPADRQHNGINTREELGEHDPRLARLLAEVFGDNQWRYVTPEQRKEKGHLSGFDRSLAPRFIWPEEMVRAYDELQVQREQRNRRPAGDAVIRERAAAPYSTGPGSSLRSSQR